MTFNPDNMLEIELAEPDDFLKVKETLTRIGVTAKESKTLYQTCHILHKMGRYFIVHFKEMFLLDGKPSSITESDIKRRNSIGQLLSDWGLVSLVKSIEQTDMAPLKEIKVIKFKEKADWTLVSKYTIG